MLSMFTGILANAENPTTVSALDSVYIALIGTALVFAVLIVLMFVLWLFGLIMVNSPKLAAKYPAAANFVPNSKNKIKSAFTKNKKQTVEIVAEVADNQSVSLLADGTCGQLSLIKTTERDAAMIMAIVADATETPLNELRFKSIKNVSEGENE